MRDNVRALFSVPKKEQTVTVIRNPFLEFMTGAERSLTNALADMRAAMHGASPLEADVLYSLLAQTEDAGRTVKLIHDSHKETAQSC